MDATNTALICKLLDLLDEQELGRIYGFPCKLDERIYLTYVYLFLYGRKDVCTLNNSLLCKITDYVKNNDLMQCVATTSTCIVTTECDIVITDSESQACSLSIIISDSL